MIKGMVVIILFELVFLRIVTSLNRMYIRQLTAWVHLHTQVRNLTYQCDYQRHFDHHNSLFDKKLILITCF